MKIIINTCFGGFGISDIGRIEYESRSGVALGSSWDISRTDPILVVMVEEDSGLYSGSHASLTVVEIPDDVDWGISDYDGREHIAEKHRVWG
tara:strand:- start:334 stop:609 length:276 start_codon:yes stop_codon:yes gene_type:complete